MEKALAIGRIGAFLLILALVVGCSRNPFWVLQPDPAQEADMLFLRDRAGVVVLPIEGLDADRSAALTTALVDALKQANVPAGAGTGAGNRDSLLLTTTITSTAAAGDDGVRVDLDWNLSDRAGGNLGDGRAALIVPSVAWQAGADKAMTNLTTAIVPEIAGLIQEDPGATAPAPPRPRVHFAGLADAPGDGEKVLPGLVAYLLEINGYEVADSGDGVISVDGAYKASPAPDDMEAVAISWRVTDPDGTEIGIVTQENVVPRGALDGEWGQAAYLIAEGAIQGVHALLVSKSESR